MSAVAGPSRGPDTWRPTKYLEPLHPDNEEVLEQAAYQAAVTKLGGDSRRMTRYKPRKAVDFQGGLLKWRMINRVKSRVDVLPPIHPNPSDLIGLLPPEAHRQNPSTSICDHFIHTSINKERAPTRVVKWTPDARRLLTGNEKGQFTLWNGTSFNYESITQVHDDSIRAMAYSHNGQALISTDKLGWIKYFTPHLTNIQNIKGHREACHGVSWSPNDERFVTGGDDGFVKVWDYRAVKEEKTLTGHGWDVRCVDWHPTKGLIASGSKDMLVKFWDPRIGKELSTLHSHKSTINACNWNPDGHIIATASADATIRLFDIRTFRELEPLKGHTREVNCLEWHPIHHSLLVSGDATGAIFHWSLLAPDPSVPTTTVNSAHEEAVFSLSFHPLGHILCSGSRDYTARFWCRARPVGGQETDRWHVGENAAIAHQQGAVEGAGEGGMRKWGGNAAKDEQGAGAALPGLPGLNAQPEQSNGGQGPTSGSAPPAGGLPGFGGLRDAGPAASVKTEPPRRGWGAEAPSSSGRAPLPDDPRRNGMGPDRDYGASGSGRDDRGALYGSRPDDRDGQRGGYGQGSSGYGGRDDGRSYRQQDGGGRGNNDGYQRNAPPSGQYGNGSLPPPAAGSYGAQPGPQGGGYNQPYAQGAGGGYGPGAGGYGSQPAAPPSMAPPPQQQGGYPPQGQPPQAYQQGGYGGGQARGGYGQNGPGAGGAGGYGQGQGGAGYWARGGQGSYNQGGYNGQGGYGGGGGSYR